MKHTHLALLKTYSLKIEDFNQQETQLQLDIGNLKAKLDIHLNVEELKAEASKNDEQYQKEIEKTTNDLREYYARRIDAIKERNNVKKQAIFADRDQQKQNWISRITIARKMCDATVLKKVLRRQDRILEFAADHLKQPKTVRVQGVTAYIEGVKYAFLEATKNRASKKPKVVDQAESCDIAFLSNPRSWHTKMIQDNREDDCGPRISTAETTPESSYRGSFSATSLFSEMLLQHHLERINTVPRSRKNSLANGVASAGSTIEEERNFEETHKSHDAQISLDINEDEDNPFDAEFFNAIKGGKSKVITILKTVGTRKSRSNSDTSIKTRRISNATVSIMDPMEPRDYLLPSNLLEPESDDILEKRLKSLARRNSSYVINLARRKSIKLNLECLNLKNGREKIIEKEPAGIGFINQMCFLRRKL